jgi:hypothetical protein
VVLDEGGERWEAMVVESGVVSKVMDGNGG